MSPRRRSRRWTRRLVLLAGMVGAIGLYRSWEVARYERAHPELFE